MFVGFFDWRSRIAFDAQCILLHQPLKGIQRNQLAGQATLANRISVHIKKLLLCFGLHTFGNAFQAHAVGLRDDGLRDQGISLVVRKVFDSVISEKRTSRFCRKTG